MRVCCSCGGLTTGSLVRSFLPIRFSAGDGSPLGSGHDLCASMARYGSSFFLSAFSKNFLIVWTVRSASPLDLGYLVTCENSHLAAKSANAALDNCGPLSDITVSGIPCLETIDCM